MRARRQGGCVHTVVLSTLAIKREGMRKVEIETIEGETEAGQSKQYMVFAHIHSFACI